MVFESKDQEKQYVMQIMKEKYKKCDQLEVTIVTTNQCNLRCVYCFEGLSGNISMDVATADHIIKDIERRFAVGQYSRLYIRFYGGEPLMNLSIIEFFNSYFRSKLQSSYSFGLVTNGVLLTEKLVKHLLDQGLSRIKVTLDGDKSNNDKRRIAKDNISTYDSVMKNLKHIPICTNNTLHVVIDGSNYKNVTSLFQDLVSNGIADRIGIGVSYTHPYASIPPEIRAEQILYVSQCAKEYGLQLDNILCVDGEGICPNKSQDALLYDVDGKKYACTGFMGMKEEKEGWVKGNKEPFINDDGDCLDCKYLPICNGGCLFLKKYYNRKNCLKTFFDFLAPELLKIYIDYEIE